jgi:hypothetical protein
MRRADLGQMIVGSIYTKKIAEPIATNVFLWFLVVFDVDIKNRITGKSKKTLP